MPLEVICAGVATMDTIATVERPPGPDERVVADPFVRAGGGPAATAAVTLARLGIPVGFCGVVGADQDGERIRADLESAGVDTRWLLTRESVPTPQSMILVSPGSRSIITTPSIPPDPQRIPIDRSAWLHVDQAGYPAVAGRAASAQLSIDGGNAIPGLDLAGTGLYAPTVQTLRRTFPGPTIEASLRAAAAAGAQRVVATDGAEGAYLLQDGEYVHVPAYSIEPVSTMGAGDVFHGALLAGLVAGFGLTDAVRRAAAAAALSCRALDGRSGIPDTQEIDNFLHSGVA
ncbi:MAG TPA: PfkB family carbohydrate kinase [Mycobacteriales bacterium]|nr:PfkB family carbohydrate kinase [Mycobacteriales bacterium]